MTSLSRKLMTAAAFLMGVILATLAQAETVDTRIGKIDLRMGLPANAQVEL
jgi:hypothetical protein